MLKTLWEHVLTKRQMSFCHAVALIYIALSFGQCVMVELWGGYGCAGSWNKGMKRWCDHGSCDCSRALMEICQDSSKEWVEFFSNVCGGHLIVNKISAMKAPLWGKVSWKWGTLTLSCLSSPFKINQIL
jgi:hypothetical protein